MTAYCQYPIFNILYKVKHQQQQLMSLLQTIKQAKQQIRQGDIDALKKNLSQLANISKQQFQANKSGIQKQLKQLTNAITANVQKNQTQVKDSQQINNLVSSIAQNLPKQTLKSIAPRLGSIVRQTQTKAAQNQQQQRIQNLKSQVEQTIFQKAVNGQNDMVQPNFTQTKVIGGDTTSIQKSVQPVKQLLSFTNLQITQPNQLPQSVNFLKRYAINQGKIPVGSVTGSDGVAFIGVQKIEGIDGKQIFLPMQKNTIVKSDIPNIPMQLRYHANRTINSWNNFVSDESKLVRFMKSVSSDKLRTTYTQQMFKRMNTSTFSAQALATVTYYYIYMPLQRFYKQITQQLIQQGITIENFSANYSLGSKLHENPLLMSVENALKLIDILFKSSNKTVIQVYQNVVKLLMTITDKISQTRRRSVISYVQKRTAQANSFFISSGVSKSASKQLLANLDISSVKKVTFLAPGGLQNNQYIKICRKITLQAENKPATNLWTLQWGSTSILAHDYIFKSDY